MRESSKAALGGIISALAITVMLITYFSPLLVYTAPPFAGLLLIVIVNEMGNKWAFGTYAAISLLSVFLIADKESAVFFTMFFGYYPILKLIIDRKISLRPIRILLKLLIFNGSIFSAVWICMFVFSIDYDDITSNGPVMLILFVVLLNVLLFIFDILIGRIQFIYDAKFRKKIRKLFRH